MATPAHATPDWAFPFDTLETLRPNRDLLLIEIRIAGRALLAELDTGAAESVVTPFGLHALGITGADLAPDPAVAVGGIGPAIVALRRHVFRDVRIGSQTMPAVPMLAGPVFGPHGVAVVLGADFFGARRVWLSYAETRVFIARPPPPA